MTLPSSQMPKDYAFKAYENEKRYIEMPYNITRDELGHMAKRIKKVVKFNKRFYKNQESRIGKRPNEQSSKENDKGSSNAKKVECFNCGGLGHFTIEYPNPKDIKKSMQATWSDIESKESNSTTFENARYNPNDFLDFIASMKTVHDSDCDDDSDNEFIDEQKAAFLNNLFVEHEKLIKNYLNLIKSR